MKDELVDSTYLRLKACATSVEQYFTWDIREDILEKDDISYQFIDSLQDESSYVDIVFSQFCSFLRLSSQQLRLI